MKYNPDFVYFMNFIASLLTKSEIKRKIGGTRSKRFLLMVMVALANRYASKLEKGRGFYERKI